MIVENAAIEESVLLAEKQMVLEDQNAALTTLYVACQRLHSSLEKHEVLLTVREIIANLIGCEQYALLTLGPDRGLILADSWGLDGAFREALRPSDGLIGHALETRQIYIRQAGDEREPVETEAGLTACIPIKLNGSITGAVVLFRLLPQKFELNELDRELFRLLETHLGIALHCAGLQEQVCHLGAAA